MNFNQIITIIIINFTLFLSVNSQELKIKDKGVTGGKPDFNPDSVIIFASPRPLLTLEEAIKNLNHASGLNLVFSESGFGLGGFWKKHLSESYVITLDLNISEALNSDELSSPNYNYGLYLIANKKNRIYNMPLSLNVQKYFFQNSLLENLKPFMSVGAVSSVILAMPYFKDSNPSDYKDIFSAIPDLKAYNRFGFSVSLGAEYYKSYKNFYSFGIKYYFIPFGGEGLESMDKYLTNIPPITNFGGIILNLSIGLKY